MRISTMLQGAGLALCASVALFTSTSSASPQGEGTGAGALGAPAPDTEVVMLKLRDGSIRWGSITQHDPDGMTFSQLSHGGIARVPWTLLDPVQSNELRTQFGYVEVATEEVLIEASVVELKRPDGQPGGELVTGIIISRNGDSLQMKVAGNTQIIPVLRVASIREGVLVPALDVYSRDELYNQYLVQTNIEDPDQLIELAKNCERILDFSHAVEHYEGALAVDPEHRADEINFVLKIARESALLQGQIEYLRDVETLRKRKHFDEALLKIGAFAGVFPESPLFERATRMEKRVLLAREAAISDLVRRQWLYHMGRLCDKASRLASYAEVLGYLEEQFVIDLEAKVLEDLHKRISEEIEPGEVREYWDGRKPGQWNTASYGGGTWLLGEDRALEGLNGRGDEAKKGPVNGTDSERQKLAEKMARYLKNQQQARRAKSRKDDAEDIEAFWRAFTSNSRTKWIRAYYAENGGDMQLSEKPRFSNCRGCAGTGAREEIYSGGGGASGGKGRGKGKSANNGGSVIKKCATCRGIGIVRKVRYR